MPWPATMVTYAAIVTPSISVATVIVPWAAATQSWCRSGMVGGWPVCFMFLVRTEGYLACREGGADADQAEEQCGDHPVPSEFVLSDDDHGWENAHAQSGEDDHWSFHPEEGVVVLLSVSLGHNVTTACREWSQSASSDGCPLCLEFYQIDARSEGCAGLRCHSIGNSQIGFLMCRFARFPVQVSSAMSSDQPNWSSAFASVPVSSSSLSQWCLLTMISLEPSSLSGLWGGMKAKIVTQSVSPRDSSSPVCLPRQC